MTRLIEVGATSRDYTTLNGVDADVGSGLPAGPDATGEKQPWIVEFYKDVNSNFADAGGVVLKGSGSGWEQSATNDITIRSFDGDGAAGNPSRRSNTPFSQNGSVNVLPSGGRGVTIVSSSSASWWRAGTDPYWITCHDLAIVAHATSGIGIQQLDWGNSTANTNLAYNLIIDSRGNNDFHACECYNIAVMCTFPGDENQTNFSNPHKSIYNCTFANSDPTPAGGNGARMVDASSTTGGLSTAKFVNCSSFGFGGSALTKDAHYTEDDINCCVDDTSVAAGSGNLRSQDVDDCLMNIAYGAHTEEEDWPTINLAARPAGVMSGAGTTDSGNAPTTDIYGNTRPGTPSIGVSDIPASPARPYVADWNSVFLPGGGSAVVPAPPNLADDDLLIVHVVQSGGSTNFTTPSGWTASTAVSTINGTGRARTFWKKAASEGASWDFGGDTGAQRDKSCMVLAIRNWRDTGTIADAFGNAWSTANSGSSSAPSSSTHTPDEDNMLGIFTVEVDRDVVHDGSLSTQALNAEALGWAYAEDSDTAAAAVGIVMMCIDLNDAATGIIGYFDLNASEQWETAYLTIYPPAGGTVDVPVGKGSLTFTGYAPSAIRAIERAVGKADVTFTGYAPVAGRAFAPLPIGKADLSFTGYAPTISKTMGVPVPKGDLTFVGYAPVAGRAFAPLPIGKADVTFTGYAPIAIRVMSIAIAKADVTFTGYAPTIAILLASIAVGKADIAFTGYAPTAARAILKTIGKGDVTFTGYAPVAGRALAAIAVGTASLSFTGYAPDPAILKIIVVGKAALAFTGYAPVAGRALAPITIGQADLTFVGYAPIAGRSMAIAVAQASLTFTGYLPTVSIVGGAIDIPIGKGDLTFVGYAPKAIRAIQVSVGTASLSFTGYVPDVDISKVVAVPAASFIFTGYAPIAGRALAPLAIGTATLAFTGYAPVAGRALAPLAVPAASLAFVGYAPVAGRALDPLAIGSAALTFTGYAPDPDIAKRISVPKADLTFTGYSPQPVRQLLRAVPLATISFTGYAPVAGRALNAIAIGHAPMTFTGYSPQPVKQLSRAIPLATISFTGYAPSPTRMIVRTVQKGDLTFTGYIPTVDVQAAGLFVPVSKGEMAFTGYAPVAARAIQRVVGEATLTFAGYIPTPQLDHGIKIPVAALAFTGYAVTFGRAKEIPRASLVFQTYAPIVVLEDTRERIHWFGL